MAFMMPVVKNDWDIYKSNRTRRVSECSNPSTCRSRKVSECRSEGPSSLSTSPSSSNFKSVPATSKQASYSRTSSRTSEASLQSPSKSSSSPPVAHQQQTPKNGSSTSLNKFHCKVLDKLKKTMRNSKDSDYERNSS